MYCQDCGACLHGKFCSECGARTQALIVAESPDLDTLEVLPDYRFESRYDLLLQYPGVREAIERESRMAKKGMTGEEFLALADKLVPQAVSMEGVAKLAQALFTRLGIRTNQQREANIAAPVGETIVRTLCSFARRGQALQNVTQASDGCVLEAAQPSDLWSLTGSLVVTIHRDPTGNFNCTNVSAVASIPGQLYDWGKNNRCLVELFEHLGRPIEPLPKVA